MSIRLEEDIMKSLRIDPDMKEKWPQTRVGCLQYQVKVEKKNEDMWSYLKKGIFKKTRDAIFDYGVNVYRILRNHVLHTRHLAKIRAVTEYPLRR